LIDAHGRYTKCPGCGRAGAGLDGLRRVLDVPPVTVAAGEAPEYEKPREVRQEWRSGR